MNEMENKIITLKDTPQPELRRTEQAAEWAAYMFADDVTEEGQKAFAQWYGASEENRRAFGYAEKSWTDLDFVTISDPVLDAELEAIAQQKTPPKKINFLSRRMVGSIAASLIIFVGFGALFLQDSINGNSNNYMTQIGEIKNIELADGSKITLAGATALKINFSDNKRETVLVEGQAYFDVARDEDRPFIVRTGGTEVSVLGTEFDIQKTSGDVRISVTEGVVRVAEVSTENVLPLSEQILADMASIKLTVGEQVYVATDGSRSEIKTFKKDSTLAWRQGVLEYYNDPLSRVIDEVNRYRKVKIALADAGLADMPVTIALAKDKTDHLFEGLELTGTVTVVQTSEGVTIHSKHGVSQDNN